MFVNFFINRPIFASVIAIFIVIAGGVCIPFMPVAQFPEIAPPTVQVSTTYTGAGAEVVEESVTAPLEQSINGVEGMTYMSSQSSSDGNCVINVTFDIGYDLKIAAVDVQNQVAAALSQLPTDVQKVGVTTKKQSTSMVLVVNLISPDKSRNQLFLSNYANINIIDVLKRMPGVGDVTQFGERKYAIRFWLDPDKMANMAITPTDVINAINSQNIQVASGRIGQEPSPKGQVFTYTITTLGRLSDVKQFEDIIVRTLPDGSLVYMKDVAGVELGAQDYGQYSMLNDSETTSIGVYQLPGANSMDLANDIKTKMAELSKRFPTGMTYTIAYDTTKFVSASIEEVIHTLFEAIFLVFVVVYIFLQSWRTTLIPSLTIPVSLIGTFALMEAFGFSINTLSLFGLVLAIGLVVDDAIVVVENVVRLIEDKGMTAKEATKQAMKEVVGPVMATTLVLFAVFIPVGFMPGLSGQLYKQFALTICCSVGISCINALTLSPALCGILLKAEKKSSFWFFRKFNKVFEKAGNGYERLCGRLIKFSWLVMIVFAGLLVVTGWLFFNTPTGFVPDEDQGYFISMIKMPEGASLDRTRVVADEARKIFESIPGVEDVLTIGGYDLVSSVADPSSATAFVILKDWSERQEDSLKVDAIIQRANYEAAAITEGVVLCFNAPPISGLSTTGGFEFELQDLEGRSVDELSQTAQNFIRDAQSSKELAGLSTPFAVNYPQFYIDLDRSKAMLMGVDISEVFTTLQAYLGSIYVNDFNKFGRVYRVYVQAKEDDRANRDDIARLYVRSNSGDMIPLSALVKVKQVHGVQAVKRYNLYRTAAINGGPAPGYTSGQAIEAMQKLADTNLPQGYSYEWTGTALQEIKSGGMAPYIFSLAISYSCSCFWPRNTKAGPCP